MVRSAQHRSSAHHEGERQSLTTALERELDSFDAVRRRQVLGVLSRIPAADAAAASAINLHTHTFFSYNVHGYSPSKYAWLARKAGLIVAGIVDLDVLDGLEEFLEAGRLLGLKTCVSLESRVFVPEFCSRVINSPGEPGIAYHMGVGFTRTPDDPFLDGMRRTAQERIRDMVARVNAFLYPVELDFDRDVVPLTPNGNVTERHACEGYERKAGQIFADPVARAAFWTQRLGAAPRPGAELQGLIRAKTMKQGGPGYVQPDGGSFPSMAEMNRFVLACGAIPTLAWLDGTSEGESAIEELFDVATGSGVAALNIIPDRNYTTGVEDARLRNLYDVVRHAERLNLPVIVGTEMNAPGNKFVDSFDAAELRPLFPIFLRGAHIAYAHSALQRQCGLGYLSAWALDSFRNVAARNDFFEAVGRTLEPAQEDRLADLPPDPLPARVLEKLR